MTMHLYFMEIDKEEHLVDVDDLPQRGDLFVLECVGAPDVDDKMGRAFKFKLVRVDVGARGLIMASIYLRS
jgi:hypothetical protein